MTINQYFDKIFVINLASRPDRWGHVSEQCQKHGIVAERFNAHQMSEPAQLKGNDSCTASHRGVLELISHHKWPRTLILEDDFEVVVPDLNAAFAEAIVEVPEDWDMLYLGGGYQSDPQYRHSKHVIRNNGMATTSSYALTYAAARKICPHICGVGPIDSLYVGFCQSMKSYTLDPRLMVQYTNHSDLQGRVCDHATSMLDAGHISRLDNK